MVDKDVDLLLLFTGHLLFAGLGRQPLPLGLLLVVAVGGAAGGLAHAMLCPAHRPRGRDTIPRSSQSDAAGR